MQDSLMCNPENTYKLGDPPSNLRTPASTCRMQKNMGTICRRDPPKHQGNAKLRAWCTRNTKRLFEVVKKWPRDEDGKPRLLLSNPPFSLKFKVLEALVEAQEDGEVKPFMLLLPSWVYVCNMEKISRKKNSSRKCISLRFAWTFQPDRRKQKKATSFDSTCICYGMTGEIGRLGCVTIRAKI